MFKVASIVEKMYTRILEFMEPEMCKNDLVAEIYHSTISGVGSTSGEQGFSGDYPAIESITTTGTDASAPHLKWDDQPIANNSGTFFKLLDTSSVTSVGSHVPFVWESRHKNISMWRTLFWKILIRY